MMANRDPRSAEPVRATGEDPRVTQTREVVLAAALALFIDDGVDAVTPQSVHKRTGVARTTIYRHWPTRLDLVLDTLDRLTVPGRMPTLTGALDADLRALLTMLERRMEKRRVRELVSATLRVALEDDADAAAQAVPRRFLDGLLAPIRDRLQQAADDEGLDAEAAERLYDRAVGPMIFRHVLMLGRVSPAQIDEVVALCVQALAGGRDTPL